MEISHASDDDCFTEFHVLSLLGLARSREEENPLGLFSVYTRTHTCVLMYFF